MQNRILEYIRQQQLIARGDKLIVALSGGPDSVCLLHMLHTLRNELGIDIHAAHLNHKLRGAESDEDSHYVSELAQSFDIPLTSHSSDVASYRRSGSLSLEEAARELRYAFLAEVVNNQGGTGIVTGHTRDDQIETILMNIIRGSGIRGLRGLQPKTILKAGKNSIPVTVIRPLIPLSRAETAEYCRQHGLFPRSDSSNQSTDFLRNRIRLELVPLLKSYNIKIEDSLLRLAAISNDDYLLIEERSKEIWHRVAQAEDDRLSLDLKSLEALPRTLQRHTMANALQYMLGSLYDIEFTHIESMAELIQKPAGKSLHLPQGLLLIKEYDRLILTRDPHSSCPFPPLKESYIIDVPGCYYLDGWKINAEIATPPLQVDSYDRFTALLDLDKTGQRLTVRTRKPGDRFYPLGMNSPKKLQDFMVDIKIPRTWRDRVPLICSPNSILWIVGWRIDERMKVCPATQRILKIRFEMVM